MNEEEINTRIKVLLSLHRALLGAVTPNLRAVFVDWRKDDAKILIKIFFVFYNLMSEDDEDEAECVATEVDADFVDDGAVETEFFQINSPEPIPELGKECVFRRKTY